MLYRIGKLTTKNYHASDYIVVYALFGLLGLSAGVLVALSTMDKWL